MPHPALPILARAQLVLGVNQEGLGSIAGVSRRTVQRWYARASSPSQSDLGAIAAALFPVDRALAAELATAAGTSLEALGLVERPPPATPPPLAASHLVDSVVCVAADACGLTPGAVRGAVLAAFVRARELRMTVEDVESGLRPRSAS